MKKLITMLSALTITSTVASTIIACSKQEAGLDLNSLNADSFKKLDIINGTILTGGTIETIDITEIKDDTTLNKSINSHIIVLVLKKVFGLSSLSPKSEDEKKAYGAFVFFWTAALLPPILNIEVKNGESKNQYEITNKKTKWEDLKIITILNKDAPNIIKPYYELIKGDEVKITISK